MSHIEEHDQEVLPGSPQAGRPHGLRAPGPVRIAVGGHGLDCREDRLRNVSI